MSAMYPPQILLLPVQLGQRLPPSLQSVDLEVILVVHTVSDGDAIRRRIFVNDLFQLLSLVASMFTVHIAYALPLALFGLVAISSALISTLLPHFLFFWILSIPMDVVWLLYRVNQERLILIALMGANMCFKVISAGQAAKVLQSQGVLPDIEGGGFRGLGSSSNRWLGNQSEAAPFGLPGSWSGSSPANGHTDQSYTDARDNARPYSTPGRNHAVNDEADAIDGDAPQVHPDRLGRLATTHSTKDNYQAIA